MRTSIFFNFFKKKYIVAPPLPLHIGEGWNDRHGSAELRPHHIYRRRHHFLSRHNGGDIQRNSIWCPQLITLWKNTDPCLRVRVWINIACAFCICHLSAEPGVWANLLCCVAPSSCVRADLGDLTASSSGLSPTFSGYYVMTDGEAVNISATFPPRLIDLWGGGRTKPKDANKVYF